MKEAVVTVRKWGNSLGIALPKNFVEETGIGPNEEVAISIRKVKTLRDLFGTFKTNKTTQEIMAEVRKGWD